MSVAPLPRAGAYRALVLDLDGTLVADDGAVRPRVVAALADLVDRGVADMKQSFYE